MHPLGNQIPPDCSQYSQECPSRTSPQKLLNRKSWRSHSISQLISSTFTLTQPHFQQLQQANLTEGLPGALQSILLLGDLHVTYAKSSSSNPGKVKWKPANHFTTSAHLSSARVNPLRQPLTTLRLQAPATTFVHPSDAEEHLPGPLRLGSFQGWRRRWASWLGKLSLAWCW